MPRPSKILRRFAADESGVVSVEAVLWLPLLFGFLMLTADVAMAFYGKAQAFRTIQDANRALAVRRISTPAQVVTLVRNAYLPYAPNATVRSVVQNGVVITQVDVPISDLVIFTTLGGFLNRTIEVQARHYLE